MSQTIKLLLALSVAFSCSAFAQPDFESTKARAEAGDSIDQYNLGVMYANGTGVAENDQEAVKWYRLAAEQGLAEAQYNLGVMYDDGEGVAENDQEAVKWFRLAAEQGFASAQFNLGVMYANGTGVAQNDQKAYMWFSVAAAQGDEGASAARDRRRNLLSPQALEQAQAQATRCFESNFQDCD